MKKRFVLCLSFLAACEPWVNSRGNTTIEENFSSFVVGQTTMRDVLGKCGTPSLLKDNYSWIYVGSQVEEDTFGNVKPTHRFNVKITFDQNKVLKSIEKIEPKESGDILMDEKNVDLMTNKQAELRAKEALAKRDRL